MRFFKLLTRKNMLKGLLKSVRKEIANSVLRQGKIYQSNFEEEINALTIEGNGIVEELNDVQEELNKKWITIIFTLMPLVVVYTIVMIILAFTRGV